MFTFSQSSLYEGLLSDYRCPCHPCCLEDISLPFFFNHWRTVAGMDLILAAKESYGSHDSTFGLCLLYVISVCNFLNRIRMFLPLSPICGSLIGVPLSLQRLAGN